MRAGTTCPACGYADDGAELVCRRCGTYLGADILDAPRSPTLPSRRPTKQREAAHPIFVALRLPDGQYEATAIPRVRVEPGGHADFVVRVTNLSKLVDRISLRIEGIPDGWAELREHTMHVLPFRSGEPGHELETEVRVTFPYSSESEARAWPIRVVAHSMVLGRRVASAAAIVDVSEYAILALELRTPALRSRHRGRTEARVLNDGNARADVALSAGDDGGLLQFSITPDRLQVGIGDDGWARVDATTKRRIWLGRREFHQFQVEAVATTSRKPVRAHGTFDQRPYLPKWVLAVPVLAAMAVALWLGRPQMVHVPRLEGLPERTAKLRLIDRGLDVKEQIVTPKDPRHPNPGVLDQDPRAGRSVKQHAPVTIVVEAGAGKVEVPSVSGLSLSEARRRLTQTGFRVGAIEPHPAPRGATVRRQQPEANELAQPGTPVTLQVAAPPAGQTSTFAFADGGRIFVKAPSRAPQAVTGARAESSDPAWVPPGGELAYVQRRAATGAATVMALDPASPHTSRPLVSGAGSYTSPAFSPRGDLMATIDDDASGYGGRLCLVAPPSRVARCRRDPGWRYGRPSFADERTLYVLRRSRSTRRRGGWDQLVRLVAGRSPALAARDWRLDGAPLAQGDLLSAAVGRDGRLAVLVRDPGKAYYHVEVLSGQGAPQQVQTGAEPSCEVAWSGNDLLVSRWSCIPQHPPGDIVRLAADDLNGPVERVVAQGEEPATRPG